MFYGLHSDLSDLNVEVVLCPTGEQHGLAISVESVCNNIKAYL